MKVLHVCSELYPLLKTGGLADVMGALPFAQKEIGIDARILLPAYPAIMAGIPHTSVVTEFDNFAGHIVLRYGEYHGVGVYLIDAPHLYGREGNPYHDGYYNDYGDNYKRFALLGWVGAELSTGLDYWWHADVVHAHDWHAGLTAAYLFNKGRPAKSVFTIHNFWNKAQEQTQLQSQQKFQQDLVAAVQAQDEKKVKEAIETFNQSVKDTITSLDALDVKAESIKSIKEQTKNVLSLASGLLVDQANMSFTNPTQTPEQQKAYAEKAEVLRKAMAELQKQSIELEQKFNPAPVAAPAQDAK